MARWSKQTYEMVARQINNTRNAEEAGEAIFSEGAKVEPLQTMTHYFATEFAADNPAFDTERFLTACGFEPLESE